MRNKWKYGFFSLLALDIALSAAAYAGCFWNWTWIKHPWDSMAHFFLLGGLAFFAEGLFRFPRWRIYGRWPVPAVALVMLILLGAEEWCQRFSPYRSSGLDDYAFTVLGVVFFTWLASRFRTR